MTVKRYYPFLMLMLLVSFGLRVWNLSGQSFWWDEAYTVQTARYDWATFWQLQAVARHPPLYFLTMKLWGNLAGWSEFSARFLSVAYSVIGTALVFQMTRRLFDRRAGVAALAVAALAPALIIYAQESRMYALAFMLAAGTLYFGYRVFDFEARPEHFRLESAALLICEALLLSTHYFALPFVAAFNLLAFANLIYHRARGRDYARWLGGQALAALPVVAWVVVLSLAQGGLTVADEARTGVLEFLRQVILLWVTGVRDLSDQWDILLVVALILVVGLLGAAWLYQKKRALILMAFGAVALGSAFVFTSVLTSFHPRYVLMFSLPAYALAGAALAQCFNSNRKRRFLGALSIVSVAFLIGLGWSVAVDPRYAKDDARSVAKYLAQHATAADVILVEAYDYTMDYYDHGPAQVKMIMAQDEPRAFQELSQAIGDAPHVWLIHWPVAAQDSRSYWPFVLEQSGELRDRLSFHGYELSSYDMQSPLREPKLSPRDEHESSLIKAAQLEGGSADAALTVALQWDSSVKFHDPAKVSLRLSDAHGERLTSVDLPLLDEQGRTTDQWIVAQSVTNYYVLPVPPGTPPGAYTVTAQLYNARDVLAEEVIGVVNLPRRLESNDPYQTLAGYQWNTPANPSVFPGLELEAYAVSPQTPWQPMPIAVALRWRKTDPTQPIEPRLRLAQNGHVWTEIGSTLFERDYPIEQWATGEMMIDRLKIDYPPVRGPIELQIGQGDRWTPLTTLQLDESQMMFSPPPMQQAQLAQFGDFAELLGYDLKSDSLAIGRPLDLTLYWRATNSTPITTPYTVFTQILAPDGHLVAQHDAPPRPPTPQWVPGQIVIDHHALEVVDPAYRGPATLIVGWYNSASVERVPVKSGDEVVALAAPVRIEEK